MLPSPYFDALFVIFVFMNLAFVLGRLTKDDSKVDVLWGIGFVVLAGYFAFFYAGQIGWFLPVLVTIWGLRLGLQLLIRNLKEGKDWRYEGWENQAEGNWPLKAYFKVYMLQGLFMFVIGLPIYQVSMEPTHFSWMQIIGILVCLSGVTIEGFADFQLFKFKQGNPAKGSIFQSGLWKYSRHPNYFGEILFWWGLFLYVLPYGQWYISIFSPVVLTGLLWFISAPMLERKSVKKPGWDEYVNKTSFMLILPTR